MEKTSLSRLYANQRNHYFKVFGMHSSQIEVVHLILAWIVVSFAFAIVFNPVINILSNAFLYAMLYSGITVGFGFLLHELAHKFVAQKYGCWAEFRADFFMLLLAVAMSFTGFVFAAPGAVIIMGKNVSLKQSGKISVAGPLMNVFIAIIFLALFFIFPAGTLHTMFAFGFYVNAWLAAFNMIPFWFFDGAKIWKWNKVIYFSVLAVSVALMIASFVLK